MGKKKFNKQTRLIKQVVQQIREKSWFWNFRLNLVSKICIDTLHYVFIAYVKRKTIF